MENFGSSLGSVHSSTDETNFADARPDSSLSSWTGLNDITSESVWEWSDGTSYDYTVVWAPSEPNDLNGQDCGQLYAAADWDDVQCENQKYQFICNLEENWRPIFKITTGLPDYGGESNVRYYWIQGESSYDGYYDDVQFIDGTFDASTIDTTNNYRSLVIDDWKYLFNNGGFDKVKVSLYKDGSEERYFVYNATEDSLSWFSQTYLIDSSFRDTGYEDYYIKA